MTSVVAVLTIIFVFFAVALGQNHSPVLLGFFEPEGEDISEALFRAGEKANAYMKDDDRGLFVVRVCSDDPLSVALANVRGNPVSSHLRLERIANVSSSKILYVRSNGDCKRSATDFSFIEFWFAGSQAGLPHFVETAGSSDLYSSAAIQSDMVQRAEMEPGREAFAYALEGVAKELQVSKTALVLITSTREQSNIGRKMRERAQEARKFLIKSGIAEFRIYVREVASKPTMGFTKPFVYPDILVVGRR